MLIISHRKIFETLIISQVFGKHQTALLSFLNSPQKPFDHFQKSVQATPVLFASARLGVSSSAFDVRVHRMRRQAPCKAATNAATTLRAHRLPAPHSGFSLSGVHHLRKCHSFSKCSCSRLAVLYFYRRPQFHRHLFVNVYCTFSFDPWSPKNADLIYPDQSN